MPRGSSPIAACVASSMPDREEALEALTALVEDAERRVAGAGQLACDLEHPVQQALEVELGDERLPDVEQAAAGAARRGWTLALVGQLRTAPVRVDRTLPVVSWPRARVPPRAASVSASRDASARSARPSPTSCGRSADTRNAQRPDEAEDDGRGLVHDRLLQPIC